MRERPAVWSGAVGLVLAVAYLLAPPMGTDLSAQTARADFIHHYGLSTVDLRWYGGVVQYGYSLVSQFPMALLSPRAVGALALVVSSVALAALFARTGARRPLLGGALGAVGFAGNLVSGRTTWALGVTFGLLALLGLTTAAPAPSGDPAAVPPAVPPAVPRVATSMKLRFWPARPAPTSMTLRRSRAAAGALLAGATSPVAGLFVGLAGVALAGAELSRRRPPWDGLVLAGAAALPLGVVSVLFGQGGWMNISRSDAVHAVLTGLVVTLAVPRPAIRIGAALSSLGVLVAFAVHTPVGLNATRLASLLALPVLAAYASVPSRVPYRPAVGVAGLVAVALWQPPLMMADLRDAGNPTAHRSYFTPLLRELTARGPVSRVEVPPTRDYWEAAYVADQVPLARGWLRQLDRSANPLFFDGHLNARRYQDWLRDNAVQYVAVPNATLTWFGRREAALIRAGLPDLTPVWSNVDWTLYQVDRASALVDGGTLIAATGDRVTLRVDRPGPVLIRIRYNRWLTSSGGTLRPAPGGWTTLVAGRPGRYTVKGAG